MLQCYYEMGENEMDDKRPIEKQEPGVVEIDDERQMREREGLAEAQAAQWDNDPNPYEGTYSEE
jgi:hypothetical protein